MTASEFVNEKLGDKNYTHSKYPMYRSEIEEWLNEYHEQQLKILNIPVVVGQSEQLICPECENPYPHSCADGFYSCEDCGHKWAN
jgi:hypothetical protein